MDVRRPCENATRWNLQRVWRHKGKGAPPIEWTPPPTRMALSPPGNPEQVHTSQVDNGPPSHVYTPTHLPNLQFFNLDTSANNHLHDCDCVPDLLTDETMSAGFYTIWCMVMQLAYSFQTKAAY